MARILGDGKRQRTRAFTGLLSHYLFANRFGRPGKGNDKGKVEALVKHGRRQFLTPVPIAESYAALNARLEADCRSHQATCSGRHTETIAERLRADLAAFRALPAAAFEPCEVRTARVSSTALVRYRGNDYSVPTSFGFREVVVKGFVDEVVILVGSTEIARHRRSYEKAALVFDPLHYLALIEQKPGALDQAAPLQHWDLPEPFAHLRRLMEARMGRKGKREYIQVLRLMELFARDVVASAVTDAIKLGAIGFDAVRGFSLGPYQARLREALRSSDANLLEPFPYIFRHEDETNLRAGYVTPFRSRYEGVRFVTLCAGGFAFDVKMSKSPVPEFCRSLICRSEGPVLVLRHSIAETGVGRLMARRFRTGR